MSKIEYSDADKKRIRGMIKAFSGARRFLHPRCGICWAIQSWAGGREERVQAEDDATQLVCRAISWHSYLEGFLGFGEGHPRDNPDSIAWRKAWLDKLIKDCKEAIK